MLFAQDMKGATTTVPAAAGKYEQQKTTLFSADFHRPTHQQQRTLLSPHKPNQFSNTTFEVESPSAPPPAAAKPKREGDGSSIEMVRRPRGRPLGSKNKPKPPPAVIARDSPDQAEVMRPHVLQVPGGQDVAAALTAFCRRRNLGLCVLSATGSLSDLSLRQPDRSPAAACAFRGRFELLSIAGTVFPPASSAAAGSR